jgi:hypothetical protein
MAAFSATSMIYLVSMIECPPFLMSASETLAPETAATAQSTREAAKAFMVLEVWGEEVEEDEDGLRIRSRASLGVQIRFTRSRA